MYIIQLKNIKFDVLNTTVVDETLNIDLCVKNNFLFRTEVQELAFVNNEGNEYDNFSDALPISVMPFNDKKCLLLFPVGEYEKIKIKIKTLLMPVSLTATVQE